MEITLTQLIGCGIPPTQARIFLAPLNQILPNYGITTRVRIAAFIAQCAHESSNFTVLEESLYYRDPARICSIFRSRVNTVAAAVPLARNPKALANVVYAGKNGNGDVASGDGWTFRGRGLIQITGRTNYRNVNYERQPDALLTPVGAVQASADWWFKSGLNSVADCSDIDQCTRIVNGPRMLGAVDRRENFREALTALA